MTTIITRLKYITVNQPDQVFLHCELPSYEAFPVDTEDGHRGMPADEIREEIVRSEKFINARGEVLRLGATEEVTEILGLPFSIFKRQQQKVKACRQRVVELESLSLWERIVFVFAPQKILNR